MTDNQQEPSPQVSSSEKFSNENINLTVEKKPHCLVDYHVKVGENIALKAYKTALKNIAKEVTIPGFRKGKAPEDLIRKKYQNSLDQKWQKEIADETFKECQKLTEIPFLGQDSQISFKMKEYSQGGAEIDFSFETEPVVAKIDIHSLRLSTQTPKEITEEKVEETIKQIRQFFAKWQKITDRPVQDGDFIIIDLTVTEEDPPKPVFNNTRVEVNKSKMAKWMYELVIDQTVGSSLEGFSKPDEDASDKEKEELTPKKVMVVIKAIESGELPELNDEFASKVGAASVAEMREKLRTLLEKQAADDARQKQREELSKNLLEVCQVDLPKSLVNKETTHRLRSMLQNESFLKDWRNKNEDERKQEQQKIEKEAENAVRLFYISKKIIADANLRITEEELHPRISSPLEAMFIDPALFEFDKKSEEEKALTISRKMLAKAEDYLIEQMEKQNLIKEST